MKNQIPPLKIENPVLLYETAEEVTDNDENNMEGYSDANFNSDKPFSRGYVANIDYDHLYEDMIFPS